MEGWVSSEAISESGMSTSGRDTVLGGSGGVVVFISAEVSTSDVPVILCSTRTWLAGTRPSIRYYL